VTFQSVDRVVAKLGSGNDTFMISVSDLALADTTVEVDGGGGDDLIEATSVASATTEPSWTAASGNDTLKIDIPSAPVVISSRRSTKRLNCWSSTIR
jgi:hypothetical protein